MAFILSSFWFIAGLALLGFGIVMWQKLRVILCQLKSKQHPQYTKYRSHVICGYIGLGLVVIFTFVLSKAWFIWG